MVQAGSSSVMVDGSHLPLEDNVELARAAVALGAPGRRLGESRAHVHGLTTTPVSLDLGRLAAIGDTVVVPLVLPGTAGLPDERLSGAIRCGVDKININTEVRLPSRRGVDAAIGARHPRRRRSLARRPRGGGDRRRPLHPYAGQRPPRVRPPRRVRRSAGQSTTQGREKQYA